MATTTTSISGEGVAKGYGNQPMASISDTLFIFDLTTQSLDAFKNLCKTTKWGTVTVYQVQKYGDLKDFERAVHALIKYAIFENQDLLEKTMIITKDPRYTEIVQHVWPEEQRAITKFRGRKWPTESFSKEFLYNEGSGVVSVSPENMDPNDILSWFWEYTYTEYEDEDGPYEYDHLRPKSIPIPLADDVTVLPDPEDPDPSDPEALDYDNITYVYKHEVTSFPLVEAHAIPAGNMTSSFQIPQNTITIDVKRMVRVICIKALENSGSGDSGGA